MISGNSCYLNSGIQCLSHISPLTSFLLSNDYLEATVIPETSHENPLTKSEEQSIAFRKRSHNLSVAYRNLLQQLWLQQFLPSTSTSASASALVVKRHVPATALHLKQQLGHINVDYAGMQQQDTHDVLETILDQLHEDCNLVRVKPYVENVEGTGLNCMCRDCDWIDVVCVISCFLLAGVNDVADGIEAERRHLMRDNSFVDKLLGLFFCFVA